LALSGLELIFGLSWRKRPLVPIIGLLGKYNLFLEVILHPKLQTPAGRKVIYLEKLASVRVCRVKINNRFAKISLC
jgi:hypothetical protein